MTASKVKNEVKNKHAINSTKASLTHSKYASVIDVPGAQLGSVNISACCSSSCVVLVFRLFVDLTFSV